MCRLFVVSGRVQGVWFRASTRDVARPLGLNGHAINLPDGTVEVRACGDNDAVEELRAWLHQGPTHAAVTGVVEQTAACTRPETFTTG